MTTKQLGYQAPPSLVIAEGAITPNPGIVGVSVWSSSLSRLVTWNGTSWDSSMVQRLDLDINTSGQAVIRKLVAGTGVTLTSTGVDAGTGDVTIDASGTAGPAGPAGAPAGNPVLVGSVTTGSTPFRVYVVDQYAYLVNYTSETLQVVNISNPTAPVVVGSVATGQRPFAVSVSGKYAYVVSSLSDILQVFDISNPAAPTLVGSLTFTTSSNPEDLFVSGRYAYILPRQLSTGLHIVDISNPSAPVIVGSLTTINSAPNSVYVSGKYAYVCSGSAMQVVNVSKPAVPVVVGSVTLTNTSGVYVSGRYAYVLNPADLTLKVIDISNPASPTIVGSVATGNSPNEVYVSGDYAYVTNLNSNTLQVFNVSTPAAPVAVGSVATGTNTHSVNVSGRYAFVTNQTSNNLQVFDVGGYEYISANVGSLEVGTAKVRNDLQVGGELQVAGGLTVTGSIFSSDLAVDTVSLDALSVEPSIPAAGTLKLYAKSIAGRIWPKWVGPSGWDMPIQQALMFNGIVSVKPATVATQTVVGTAVTNVGTLTTPALSTGSVLNSTRRTLITAAATTAGTLISQRAAATIMWRGNAAGLGGFVYGERFSLAVLVAGQRAFVGISDSTAAPTNIDPTTSTTPGKIGLAVNTNTGNWNLVYNVTGTTPNVLALGANFPVNVTDILDLVLFSPPNGTYIGYRVKNMTSGVEVSGTLTTNIPSNTTFLLPWKFMTNNATALTFAMNSLGWTVETDQ